MRYQFATNYLINQKNIKQAHIIASALDNQVRLMILAALNAGPLTITELSKITGVPTSNIVFHVNILEKANIIKIRFFGKASIISLLTNNINFEIRNSDVPKVVSKRKRTVDYEIPLGNYIDIKRTRKSGVDASSKDKRLEEINSENIFDSSRFNIDLFSLTSCQIIYPLKKFKNEKIREIHISLELCSEIAFYRNDIKSEIVFYINDIELTKYTLKGDFGGRRGLLNPSWYGDSSSQYGTLIDIVVSELGVTINGELLNSKVKIDNLKLDQNPIDNTFTFGTPDYESTLSGFNLFGKSFGDYPQNIKVKCLLTKDD